MKKIGLLGTGLMGAPMARNLLSAGFKVNVWNRSSAKARALEDDGAVFCETPIEAVAGVDVVISMLADGPVVGSLVNDDAITSAMKPKSVWIDMSSAKPKEARAQAALLRGLSIDHLDAPVSGGTKGAEAGTLAIMVGGDQAVFAAHQDVLSAMGRPVRVGPSGSGQLAKLANQGIVATTIGAVAEAMLLIEKGGADPAAMRDALKGGFADSTILQQHGKRMTDGDFEPGGLTKFQIKDLRNLMEEAAGLGLKLPMGEDVLERFEILANELGGAEQDHSALYRELLKRNGIES